MKETIVKKILKEKGWSYRSAAQVLGVTYQYLSDVANGIHTSRRLAVKIIELPQAPIRTRNRRLSNPKN